MALMRKLALPVFDGVVNRTAYSLFVVRLRIDCSRSSPCMAAGHIGLLGFWSRGLPSCQPILHIWFSSKPHLPVPCNICTAVCTVAHTDYAQLLASELPETVAAGFCSHTTSTILCKYSCAKSCSAHGALHSQLTSYHSRSLSFQAPLFFTGGLHSSYSRFPEEVLEYVFVKCQNVCLKANVFGFTGTLLIERGSGILSSVCLLNLTP